MRESQFGLSVPAYRASFECMKNIYIVGSTLESLGDIRQKVAFLEPKVVGFLSVTPRKKFLKINGVRIRVQHILEHHKTYFSRGRIFYPFLKVPLLKFLGEI